LEFKCILLNIINLKTSKQLYAWTLVDIRIVLKNALQLGAVGIILVHNHPSGTLQPSLADKQLTQKVKTAGESLDIKVLDHIIITEKAYFSFADDNLL